MRRKSRWTGLGGGFITAVWSGATLTMMVISMSWPAEQQSSGNTRELRVYKNNGNGTIDASQIEVDGAWRGGLNYGGVAGATLTMMGISISWPADNKHLEAPANFAFIKTTATEQSMHRKSRWMGLEGAYTTAVWAGRILTLTAT
jgi:hypothetical protein